MVNFCAVCGCCTQTDIVREHLEDTLRICDVSAMGLYNQPRTQGLSSCGEDPGRRWSRDLQISSRFLINYLGFLYYNHTESKL
jgi:hypothetical protein